ncbi:MAG: hypothetical protein BRD30_10960 [Bacteroidetes bacterium QH_2_63_10]|nr:MAG: hypothetical protein BRD30_10960 [Bacteroidetes bacterium QH_2_63_10]
MLDIDGNQVQEVVEKNNPVGQPTFHWGDGESDNVYAWADAAYPFSDAFFIDIDDRIILSGEIGENTSQREEVRELLEQNGIENVARVQTFSSGIDTQTWGIDLTAKYQTTINESGRLQLTGAFNQTQSQVNSDVRTPQ